MRHRYQAVQELAVPKVTLTMPIYFYPTFNEARGIRRSLPWSHPVGYPLLMSSPCSNKASLTCGNSLYARPACQGMPLCPFDQYYYPCYCSFDTPHLPPVGPNIVRHTPSKHRNRHGPGAILSSSPANPALHHRSPRDTRTMLGLHHNDSPIPLPTAAQQLFIAAT